MWVLVLLAISLTLLDPNKQFYFLYPWIKTIIECFILGWVAFLVFKQVLKYNRRKTLKTVTFRGKSQWLITMITGGIALTMAHIILVNHYSNVISFDTILVAILLLYFLSQIFSQSQPKLFIYEEGLTIDDFSLTKFEWNNVEKVTLDPEYITIKTNTDDFKLDFSGFDDFDSPQLRVELAANVLDGRFAELDVSENVKETLQQMSADKKFTLEVID